MRPCSLSWGVFNMHPKRVSWIYTSLLLFVWFLRMTRTKKERSQQGERRQRSKRSGRQRGVRVRRKCSPAGEPWMVEMKKQERDHKKWDLKTVFWDPEETTFQVGK
jgi:hypothetical protein